ncbi:MAG: RidA family protein [Sulfurovum sp.]|nr:RidA family protein [Sulfurovaceae bacterium]
MKIVASKNAPEAIGPYSQAIEVNGFIYTSGQIAMDEQGIIVADDIENQTHQVMKNLFYILEAAETYFNDVIKTTIYLIDMRDFEKVNAIYAHYFGMHKPARSTVSVRSLPKNALIEIECIALSGTNYTF